MVGEGIYGEGQLLSVGDGLFFFGLQSTARLKLQFQSGTPLFKSLNPSLKCATFQPACMGHAFGKV